MLTLFTIPKPFAGAVSGIQETAIESWRRLDDDIQIVLLGDEGGVADAAVTHGVEHVPSISRGASGTPLVDGAFAAVDAVARFELRCFTNADIVFDQSLLAAARAVASAAPRFLIVGQTRDVEPALAQADPEARRRLALERGRLRGAAALDWFVFTRGLFDPIPPFHVGRAGYDNWLVWRARQRAVVVDATAAVLSIHQSHDYGHVQGGKNVAYYGPEAVRNLELAGGKHAIFTLHDASHKMASDLSVRRNPGAVLRAGERVRKLKWKLGLR